MTHARVKYLKPVEFKIFWRDGTSVSNALLWSGVRERLSNWSLFEFANSIRILSQRPCPLPGASHFRKKLKW